jgi:hypothetical protein
LDGIDRISSNILAMLPSSELLMHTKAYGWMMGLGMQLAAVSVPDVGTLCSECRAGWLEGRHVGCPIGCPVDCAEDCPEAKRRHYGLMSQGLGAEASTQPSSSCANLALFPRHPACSGCRPPSRWARLATFCRPSMVNTLLAPETRFGRITVKGMVRILKWDPMPSWELHTPIDMSRNGLIVRPMTAGATPSTLGPADTLPQESVPR